MSLEKIFLDMLSPDWYTQLDAPYTPIGNYIPISASSQLGDSVFGYSALDKDSSWICSSRTDAIRDATAHYGLKSDNDYETPPFIYKVYGTVDMNAGEVCTINPENVEQVPLRYVDGELCVVSEKVALEIDEGIYNETELEEDIEISDDELSLFDDLDFLPDDPIEYETEPIVDYEMEEEDIESALRGMDSALHPSLSNSAPKKSYSK